MIGILKSVFISVEVLILTAGVVTVEAQDYSWSHLPVITRPVFRKDSFSIVAYGARPDGITLNTAAINAAIEDCSRKGGGVVVVWLLFSLLEALTVEEAPLHASGALNSQLPPSWRMAEPTLKSMFVPAPCSCTPSKVILATV